MDASDRVSEPPQFREHTRHKAEYFIISLLSTETLLIYYSWSDQDSSVPPSNAPQAEEIYKPVNLPFTYVSQSSVDKYMIHDL